LLPPRNPSGEHGTTFRLKAPAALVLPRPCAPAMPSLDRAGYAGHETFGSHPPSPLLVGTLSEAKSADGAEEDEFTGVRKSGKLDFPCWAGIVQPVLRTLLVLSVVIGITIIVAITHGLDGDVNWPFSRAQGMAVLANMPAGFAFFFISDLIAVLPPFLAALCFLRLERAAPPTAPCYQIAHRVF